MKIRITENSGAAIPKDKRYLFEMNETTYDGIRIWELYSAYGIIILKDRADILINPPSVGPMWIPQYLYEIEENSIPNNWIIKIIDDSDDYAPLLREFGISIIIGYSNLVNDYSHYVGIIERDERCIADFFKQIGRSE